jgi:hypothetical protein
LSTNFYHRPVGDKEISDDNHIGLSASSIFKFHSYPKKGLTTYQAWLKYLQNAGIEIVSEYNEVWPLDKFIRLVTRAKDEALSVEYANSPVLPASTKIKADFRYRDEEGHLFASYNFS